MNRYYGTADRSSGTKSADLFPRNFSTVIGADFLVRIDLIGAMACTQKTPIDIYLKENWKTFVPEMSLDASGMKSCRDYFQSHRHSMELIANGERIRRPMMILSALVTAGVLYRLSVSGSREAEPGKIRDAIVQEMLGVVEDIYAVEDKTDGVIETYFENGRYTVSERTYALLIRCEEALRTLYGTLCEWMGATRRSVHTSAQPQKTVQISEASETQRSAKAPTETVPKAVEPEAIPAEKMPERTGERRGRRSGSRGMRTQKDMQKYIFFNTPLRRVKVTCLLYLCVADTGMANRSREERIRRHWQEVFDGYELTPRLFDELNTLIEDNTDLSALDMLFQYSLKEIRSGRMIRSIVVPLCVHRVLSILPPDATVDSVTDEAMILYERFAAIRVGTETKDAHDYIQMIASEGNENVVDSRICALLKTHSALLSGLLESAVEAINSADSARQHLWWENILNERAKEVDDLKNQIGSTRKNAIYQLIALLSDSTYNYVLSRLFRFTYGVDSLTENEVRVQLKMMFQALYYSGVGTTGEELIGCSSEAAEQAGAKILKEMIPDLEIGRVAFPGWSVAGDIVTHPIACISEEEPETL